MNNRENDRNYYLRMSAVLIVYSIIGVAIFMVIQNQRLRGRDFAIFYILFSTASALIIIPIKKYLRKKYPPEN